jgi:hypothetical protein
MSENDRILDKIKKCMAMAGSSNEHEAASALRQAQALMKKHGISHDEVRLSNVETATANAGKSKNPPRYNHMLVHLISSAFSVRPIYHEGFEFTRIEFIGFDSQPEIASYCYEVLYRQLTKDRAVYQKTLSRYKRANKIRKADLFAEAWVNSVYSKVSKLAMSEEQAEMIDQFIGKRGDALTAIQGRKHKMKREDCDAVFEGRAAGKNANLFHGTGQDRRAALTQH